MVRKRAAGGGRKPKGPIAGKVAAFNTRISAETRAALENEAKLSDTSISQMAEILLKQAIQSREEQQRDAPMRALCYLIAQAGRAVPGMTFPDGTPAGDWRTDPFLYEAFRIAVGHILDALRPAGDITPPMQGMRQEAEAANDRWSLAIANSFASPEVRGRDVAMTIMNAFNTHEPLTGSLLVGAQMHGTLGKLHAREHYNMPRARADLTIPATKRGKS